MHRLNLTIPVHNEETTIVKSLHKLYSILEDKFQYDWTIVLSENASTDNTKELVDSIEKKYPRVKTLHTDIKGKGNAIRHSWMTFDSDVYAFTDIDLSTDPKDLENLVDGITKQNNDIVIGNRYLKESESKRSFNRLLYSKVYLGLVKTLYKTNITDFQCGFKAVNRSVVLNILPEIYSKGWFFDSELLLRSEKLGYRIKELPIKWTENNYTKTNVIKTGYDLVKNLISLRMKI